MKISQSELRELELRRSQEDLKGLLEALRADGEIVVTEDLPADEPAADDAAPAADGDDAPAE